MTVQVTEADKRFTDMTGKIYAGMTTEDAKKENVESVFIKADEDEDGILSYEEMFSDLKKDREMLKSTKTHWFWLGMAAGWLGVLTKAHAFCLGCAGYSFFKLLSAKNNIHKIDEKYREWTKLYSEMEAAQA